MLRACTMKTISRCGCSMIAATATDHIGAKPVPLATRTIRPAWPFLKKARPYGPITLTRCPARISWSSAEETCPSVTFRM
jgi:hypothetical protein